MLIYHCAVEIREQETIEDEEEEEDAGRKRNRKRERRMIDECR